MKKILNVLTASILCLSLVSCTAAGTSPAENTAGNSPEETAAGKSSEETSHDNSPEETAAADNSGELPAGELTADTSSEDIDYTTGTPWMYIDLVGNVTADTPSDPKDNFALWANKDRILSLQIPEGYGTAGDLVDITLKADADRKAMFHGPVPENHDARLAYDYYYLLGDWDSRNAVGVAPLKEMIDVVDAVKSLEDMTGYLANTPGEDRLYRLWTPEARQNPEEPGSSMLSLKRSAFFLLDRAEYREMTDEGKYQLEVFSTFLQKMLVKLGYSEEEARQKIDNCFAWETMMNSVDPDEEKSGGSEFTNDIDRLYTRDELMALTPNVPLLESLEKADGYPAMDKYYIPDPVYFERLNELYTEENLPLMRDYLIMQGILEMADVLDWESYVLVNECFSGVNHDDPPKLDTETYPESGAYGDVNLHLGWAVAQFYVEKYTNPEDKERISKLVDEIVDAYHGIIAEADFISDETRAGAYAKLDNLSKNVLYPDNWDLYSFEDVDFASKEEGGTLWDAYRAIIKHEHRKDVSKATGPYDKTVWDSFPFGVNCGYEPAVNGIYINAGFAQGNNYYPGMSDEELYAKVGAGIAHEISHAFDAEGSKYDKDGNMNNWWTEEDRAAFLKRNEKLVAYYNAMHPWEGQDFDGDNMKGEACADMAAVKCMLRIAAEKEDFDYDKFFRAFADRYACLDSPAMAMVRLEDVHPMNYLRVNGVLQQYDEFLDFYGISEGDNMYLAPEDRVAIW